MPESMSSLFRDRWPRRVRHERTVRTRPQSARLVALHARRRQDAQLG